MTNVKTPDDTVYGELEEWATYLKDESKITTDDLAKAMAVYMLGFKGYEGFI